MTPAQLDDRIVRLEQRLARKPDPRARAEAVAEASKRIIAAVDALDAGLPPTTWFERALVDNDSDIPATLRQIAAAIRARLDR
jgi:hypothetical protein